MRIGYILLQFPVVSETFIMNELIELINKGQEVYVFSLIRPKEQVVHPEVKEYRLLERTYYLPAYTKLSLELLKPQAWPVLFSDAYEGKPAKSKLLGKLLSAATINYLPKVINDFHLDVLHTHFYGLPTFVTMQVSQRTGVPFTFTCHAFDIFIKPNAEIMRKHMEAAAKVITPSHYNKAYLHSLTGVSEEKIEVIRACTNIDKFRNIQRHETGDRLLSVARLVEKKGYSYAIMAVKQLIAEFPKIQLRIVGSGPLETELKKLTNSLHLDTNVTLLGSLSSNSLTKELAEATIFVLPCVRAKNGDMDACPLTLQEAMLAGIPVISTNIGSIPELITDGREGSLADERNVEQLAHAIKTLLYNADLRREMGEVGRKKIEKEFNIHTEVEKLLDIWKQLLFKGKTDDPRGL